MYFLFNHYRLHKIVWFFATFEKRLFKKLYFPKYLEKSLLKIDLESD